MKTLALLGLLALASTSAAQNIRIVVVSHGQAADPFWSVAKNGAEEAAKEMGVRVEWRAPDTFDMVRMSQLIDAAVASKPDGLIVTIPDKTALSAAIQRAVKAGIPVVSMNSGSDVAASLGILAHVGQDEYPAGVGAGKRMKALGVTKAVCINQEVGNASLDARCKGFFDGLGSKGDVLPVKIGDPTAIRNAVTAYMQKNPTTNGILTLGPSAAEPVLSALEAGNMLSKVKFGTFDLSTGVLNALSANKMTFAIDQQQWLQGYLPVVLLTNYKRYGLMTASDIIYTGPGFVTPQNAKQVVDLAKKGIR
ncbi:simple sugar transport system substrate-binding protein [Deinococcus metalli]|uniref:Simple sugar transport system substrate-binding protein n=1 Tax=Deinococcus metalli TaxID=1141878 RepID=A0A7W8KCJ6_9DEIO|nr:sugar ABC transporter substrate-binding protein [Deinococcus metalli]MBB5375692.1 simple sugar transport system substrate-binding protein [Deinococcus metalli]GHF37736.1 sugar ABC transporter substrate-binding protein [Deinococcus metalli]